MLQRIWGLLHDSVEGYIEDDAMSRGAAIAYYTVFSIAPLLVIATAIAGLVFGRGGRARCDQRPVARPAGRYRRRAVEAMVARRRQDSGTIATLIGVVTLLLTASGVFSELQSALNVIWRAPPPSGGTVTRLMRAKLASLGLVAATGFLLLVSLIVSAVLSAIVTWFRPLVPGVVLLLGLTNFADIFPHGLGDVRGDLQVLPDRHMAWRDVAVGAVVTAFLFTIGKSLIGWYIGSSRIATSYGAAGALMVVLLWMYYSAQVFLLGAEFTTRLGRLAGQPRRRRRWRRSRSIPAGGSGAATARARARRPRSARRR